MLVNRSVVLELSLAYRGCERGNLPHFLLFHNRGQFLHTHTCDTREEEEDVEVVTPTKKRKLAREDTRFFFLAGASELDRRHARLLRALLSRSDCVVAGRLGSSRTAPLEKTTDNHNTTARKWGGREGAPRLPLFLPRRFYRQRRLLPTSRRQLLRVENYVRHLGDAISQSLRRFRRCVYGDVRRKTRFPFSGSCCARRVFCFVGSPPARISRLTKSAHVRHTTRRRTTAKCLHEQTRAETTTSGLTDDAPRCSSDQGRE